MGNLWTVQNGPSRAEKDVSYEVDFPYYEHPLVAPQLGHL